MEKKFAIVVAVAILLFVLTVLPTHASPPVSGEWNASTEFGELEFTVNNSGTGISKISFNFSDWTCGPITRTGRVSKSCTPDWPISSGQFIIETDVGGWMDSLPMTISGKFDETGTAASGTWEAVSSGVTCSGTWSANPPTPTPVPVFDTGSPSNPYPSIFGTHNGTIKPNQTITVSKLYTYPCSGTGGHSEYMNILDSSDWNVTARWDGYKGDWHNISFGSPFTLEEGETYNYTIRTGSYPQIHHTDNLSTSAGFITCSEFVDANGKRYNGWIPAVRLE